MRVDQFMYLQSTIKQPDYQSVQHLPPIFLLPLKIKRERRRRRSHYITGDDWGKKKDQNTSGQRSNKFNTSYRDISVIVAENNSVVTPKYQQYTSLNKMLSNFSKVFMAHISFTAVINNGGIGGIRNGTKKNDI